MNEFYKNMKNIRKVNIDIVVSIVKSDLKARISRRQLRRWIRC